VNTDYLVVFVTASGSEEAERIAEALVTESLAACVNIVDGCRSIYRWKGELVRDEEALLVVKTSRSRFQRLERRVTELHSYDVPEVIGVDVGAVSPGYAAFLEENLS